MKLMTVVGARPQFIKIAPVSAQLRQRRGAEEIVVHTGQHYDHAMSQVFFDELGLRPPVLNLGIGSGGHGDQTGRMLMGLERIMLEQMPDRVLIYGDTNSTLAGCLAAAKLHIPVAHVEAGLRSFNRAMPEEINRLVADQLSDLLFAPSRQAVENLLAEGRPAGIIAQVGDVMYDMALRAAELARSRSGPAGELGLEPGGYGVATVHRAENVTDPQRLRAIIQGLGMAAAQMPMVMPLHPHTRHRMEELGLRAAPGLLIREPVSYLDMASLLAGARLVATDSGGLQKEAFYHRVPCLTLRGETEWVELAELGWNTLADPASADVIAGAALGLMRGGPPPDGDARPYGDGRAAEKIVERLLA